MAGITKSIATKARQLRETIHRHDRLYYKEAQPEISDEQYDVLLRELQDLEAQHPALVTPDSPTQRVGGEPVKSFPAVSHRVPMLSLANTYSEDEIYDFDRRIRSVLGDQVPLYSCELKFDGVSLSLWYEDLVLTTAVTRGDGITGDEVTANARTIRSIPLRLAAGVLPGGRGEVRGEVLITAPNFEAMNEERRTAGEKPFVNPRNATAGTLKLQDAKLVATVPSNFSHTPSSPIKDLESR